MHGALDRRGFLTRLTALAELYDAATGTWTSTRPLHAPAALIKMSPPISYSLFVVWSRTRMARRGPLKCRKNEVDLKVMRSAGRLFSDSRSGASAERRRAS